jgi:hypothetical protein
MGINSATKTKFVGKGLTLKSVQSLDVGNRIDVDGNALAFKFLGNGNKHIGEILSDMALHLKQLAYSGGFVVTVIFDGDQRPDCKRASLQRKKSRFLNDANRMFCRFKTLQLKAQFEKHGNREVKKKLDEYSKECEKLEKLCRRVLTIPSNVASLFSDRLMMVSACSANENGGFVDENVLTATFQADSLIAARSVSNLNDFIYGNDSDYLALLGSECLLMWNMKATSGKHRGRKRKNDDKITSVNDATQYEVEIYGACNTQMKELQSRLKDNSSSLPQDLHWKEAEIPFFASPDPILRTLIALSLGCDVFDGIKELGPKTIKDKIDIFLSENKEVVPALKDLMKSKMKELNDSVLNCLVASFMFEPGLIDTKKKVVSSYDSNNDRQQHQHPYIHDPPEDFRFPPFIKSFSILQSENQLQDQPHEVEVNDPPLCHCNGFNRNGQHTYLKYEGTHTCTHCNNIFCKTCIFLPTKDIPKPTKTKPNGPIYFREEEMQQQILCLDCFKAKRYGEEVVAAPDEYVPNSSANVSINEMRMTLNNKTGLQLSNNDATVADVMDMYDMYVSSPLNTTDAIHLARAKESIKFPFFSSDSIEGGNVFEKVGEVFDFSNGGRFISDINTVDDENVPKVLELITSLLKYDEDLVPKNESNDVYIGKYSFLPSMFLNLAYYSRVDTGYRLLDRCARHTCDPKSASIYYQNAWFCEYNDKNENRGKNHFFLILILCLSLHF